MFGGLSFLVNGNMAVGIVHHDLCVRADPDRNDELLGRPHARVMDFTGRVMRGWVYVAPDGVAKDEDLRWWLDQGVSHAAGMPPKAPGAGRSRKPPSKKTSS